VTVVSRTEEHAAEVAGMTGASYHTFGDISSLPPADIIIYCVSDSVLEEVITLLPPGRMLALHTAGSISLDIFRDRTDSCGVLYPLQTFTRGRTMDFREIPLCIEANTPESRERLERLAVSLSRRVEYVTTEQRLTLHLAAVLVNNFVNHLYMVAGELLQEKELPFDILQPLIRETAAKALTMGPRPAQTGPAVRNDENVIKKHLELLSCSPGLQRLYRLLTDSIRQSMHPEEP